MEQCDILILGGGLAGSALAANLADAGLRVLILEREVEFHDRVRGEWIAPWGVAESQALGIYDLLMAAGGHHTRRSVTYDHLIPPPQAEASGFAVTDMLPGVPGPLCMEHVAMQNILLDHACQRGAEVRRGVGEVWVHGGAAPRVSYRLADAAYQVACRLIVGADGRSSTVRRQLNMPLDEQPLDHLISGLLVDGADGWPDDVQAAGNTGDIMYFVFPQGAGKVRVYVDYKIARRGRYAGERGAQELLRAFDTPCLPHGHSLATARPIGPCHAYPSQDANVDVPCADGAVLIGDAAGYTDPIFGQGLSIALRDARMARDAILGTSVWNAGTFTEYCNERRERIRRIMCGTRFFSTLFVNFADTGQRARAFQRLATQPELGSLLASAFVGPEKLPPEVFTSAFHERIFGD